MVDKIHVWPKDFDYLLFIDESGTKDLNDLGNYPILSLCGCIFSREEYSILKREFGRIKELFWPPNGCYSGKPVCLISNKIRNQSGPFNKIPDKELFYNHLNEAIEKVPTIILASIIDKLSFLKRYGQSAHPPYELAIVFMLERFCMFLLSRRARGGVIIESRGKKEDLIIETVYTELLSRGCCNVKNGTFSSYVSGTDYRKVFRNNGIYFNSKWSHDFKNTYSGLELADLCAYLIGSRYLGRSAPAFNIIKKKIRGYPKIKGMGIKVFP